MRTLLQILFAFALFASLYCFKHSDPIQSKPHQQFGHKIITPGKIFEIPMIVINKKDKPKFRSYNPITEQRKYNWALIK